MSKLIYVDRLKKDILALHDCYNGFSDTYDKACIIGVIDEQPTVDAVPVRHGRWMHISPEPEVMLGWMPWYCSECGVGVGKHPSTFCPNCGADMRKDGDHHED